jgi:hypothetical protein
MFCLQIEVLLFIDDILPEERPATVFITTVVTVIISDILHTYQGEPRPAFVRAGPTRKGAGGAATAMTE